MPDLRFFTEATFIIGCGVGFLSGTLVSWTLHAWTLAGMETDRPFEGGRLKAFQSDGSFHQSLKSTETVKPLIHQDDVQRKLALLILNKYGEKPREGVHLSQSVCHEYGIKRGQWKRLTRELVEAGKAYRVRSPKNGKLVTVMRPTKARNLIINMRGKGVIGGVPLPHLRER